MQRTLLNIVLLMAVAGLGAALYFGQGRGSGKHPPLLAHVKPSQIRHISIQYPHKPSIVLEKKKGQWFMVKPVSTPAQDSQVHVLTSLPTLKAKRTFNVSNVNLGQLSLKPPQWTLKLNNKVLEFGGRDPIKHQRYVRIGDKVYMVSLTAGTPLDSDYSDLVNHRIVPRGRKLEAVTTHNFTLRRGAREKWTLSHPPGDAAHNAAYKLAHQWMQARGEWLKMLGKNMLSGKPLAEATLKLDNGQSIHYLELDNQDQLVLARKDLNVAYYLPGRDGSRLFQVPKRQSGKHKQQGQSKAASAPRPGQSAGH